MYVNFKHFDLSCETFNCQYIKPKKLDRGAITVEAAGGMSGEIRKGGVKDDDEPMNGWLRGKERKGSLTLEKISLKTSVITFERNWPMYKVTIHDCVRVGQKKIHIWFLLRHHLA